MLLAVALLLIPVSFTPVNNHKYQMIPDKGSIGMLEEHLASLYDHLRGSAVLPGYDAFSRAVTGYFNLKASGKINNELLTIIDFSLSSNSKRMWIIYMPEMKLVHTSLVSHGRNSGEEFARQFSNIPSSHKSSLGFYITGDIYYGRHGKSLYLDGVEYGINNNARFRTIVMHSAEYVSNDYIRIYGRLGRSFGCPAIPVDGHQRIIRMLSGRSCLYIHYPDNEYLSKSDMFEPSAAMYEMAYLTERLYNSCLEQTLLIKRLPFYRLVPGDGSRSADISRRSLSYTSLLK